MPSGGGAPPAAAGLAGGAETVAVPSLSRTVSTQLGEAVGVPRTAAREALDLVGGQNQGETTPGLTPPWQGTTTSLQPSCGRPAHTSTVVLAVVLACPLSL